jgi:hypothetical protein
MISRMRPLLVLALAPLVIATGCASGPPPDGAVRLGARGVLGYHLRAGAASEVPGDAVGFVITANGVGGYRLAWVALDGNASTFSATIETDGTFDPASTLPLSGYETITASADGQTLTAASIPTSLPDGVDFVPSLDPVYIDARIDGAPADIYFTGADTSRLRVTALDPVAFTSP